MRNTALLSMVFISSIIFASLIVNADARVPCHCFGEECDQNPGDCKFGETRVCGRRVCAKGPGERCGGPMHFLGRCSDSLMCSSDERCHGCINNRLTVLCFSNNGYL